MGGNLYFAGMIGSGKTTLGRGIAAHLRRQFVDLDEEMDRRLGYSFHRLVAEQGWLAFRELEYTICKQFARLDRAVVCLGGGTVRYEWNRDLLAGSGNVILLEVSLDELVRRVREADRPRVNPGTDLEADVRLIWSEHRDKYYEAADLVYPAEGKHPHAEIRELAGLIAERRW
jgi:shikimate kinase